MIAVVDTVATEPALALIEVGAIVVLLSVLARLAGRLGITAIPLYLLAGLALGDGGVASLDLSGVFIRQAGQIGVLLLLLSMGLEYSPDELRHGLRTGVLPGVVDAVANFTPGLMVGLVLGWRPSEAVLLGGVCWVSSSGIVSKVLADFDRVGNPETPGVLNLLVIEDLAMAVYLPVVGALVVGTGVGDSAATVAIALAAVAVILSVSLRWGDHLTRLLAPSSDEALLLAVFGLTLLVGGLAEEVEVSAAIGAFLVGLALSGSGHARTSILVGPLRDLFAALFFLSFSFPINPGDLVDVLAPATVLALLGIAGKLLSGWVAGRSVGADTPGRVRAGTVLIARGEFSMVIAALGAATVHGHDLASLAAGFVLVTALVAPIATKYADRVTRPRSGRAEGGQNAHRPDQNGGGGRIRGRGWGWGR